MNIKKQLNLTINASHPDRVATNELVQLCNRLALAYLRHRKRSGSIQQDCFGINLEDLAIDCFAELFQRDDTGRLIVLEKYFGTMPWSSMSEQELFVAFRRLVCSKVNEGLFRNYRDDDPNLARIIRNVKEAIKRDDALKLVRLNDGAWLMPTDAGETPNNLPLAPLEILQPYLFQHLAPQGNTYVTVSSFVQFVKEHPHYRNGFPITGFAQALRQAFALRGDSVESAQEDNDAFEVREIEDAIAIAADQIQHKMKDTYLKKGKLCPNLFNTYFQAVQHILKSHFVRESDYVRSHFDALKVFMPDVSREAYATEHRNILQYLFKLSRTQMIDYLQAEA